MLREKIQISTNAKVKIKGSVYPGACITISDVSLNIKQERSCTKYIKEKGEIVAQFFLSAEILCNLLYLLNSFC